jgi:hypothetical protein
MWDRRSDFRWSYRPRIGPPPRPAEAEAQRATLATALRAGHAAGVRFDLAVRSGPSPSIGLTVPDAGSARWVDRVLTGAYDPHQWTRDASHSPAALDAPPYDGRRIRPWPDPLRTPSDGPSITDALIVAFRTLPAGASARLRWEAVPAKLPAWWEPRTVVGDVPPTPRPRPSVGPHREPYPGPPADRPLFWRGRVTIELQPPAWDTELASKAGRALEAASRNSGGNGLRLTRRRGWPFRVGPAFEVSELELALLLPSRRCPASEGPRIEGRHPSVLLPLGRSADGAVIGPPIEPDQGRHLAVLGETGMGKSSLLIAASRRAAGQHGLVFFDPLGDTARSLRSELDARDKARLLWVSPGASASINALAGIGEASGSDDARSDRQLNDLVHALRRVRSGRYTDSGFWGPRLEEMLTRALRAAAAFPDGTLADAHLLLASGGRGFRTVPPSAVDAVRELGDRIRNRPDDAEGARRLLYEVTRNPTLSGLLCDRNASLSVADLVEPGRLVLIAGDATAVGETTSRYLLSVYLALIWSALLSRTNRPKTFVVLDEAQWFAHESLAEMLRLGRRLNVHVVLATQSIASLPEGVAEAMWTNVADFVAFRGSPEEAREFARVAHGVTAEELLSLPRGAAVALLGKGHEVHWLRTARWLGGRPLEVGPLATATPPPAEIPREPGRPLAAEPPAVPDLVAFHSTLAEAVQAAVSRPTAEGAAGSLVRVSLDELRTRGDPTGHGVRALGSFLRRTGALVRIDRTDAGTFWWLDPVRLNAGSEATSTEAPSADTEPAQP